MNLLNQKKLKKIANNIRIDIVNNSSQNKIPHLGSCLSVLDILVYLYFYQTNLTKKSFNTNNRDKIVLSKGHSAPALFCVLKHKKLLPFDLEKEYQKISSFVGEHPPTPSEIYSVEAATGSLGHGFSMSIGMALSKKINKYKSKVFCIVGDGEINEGVIWEGAMFASKQKLDNLFVFIDFNKWQATDRSINVLDISNLNLKWSSFGWSSKIIDGHSYREIDNAIKCIEKTKKPKVIICNTVKGKGISFMEDDNNWHYRTPNKSELELAIQELRDKF